MFLALTIKQDAFLRNNIYFELFNQIDTMYIKSNLKKETRKLKLWPQLGNQLKVNL